MLNSLECLFVKGPEQVRYNSISQPTEHLLMYKEHRLRWWWLMFLLGSSSCISLRSLWLSPTFFEEGALVGFESDKLVKLVTALFSDTPLRAETIQQL